jgi:hypothetical protein
MLTVYDVPVSSAAGLSAALVADWDRSRLLLSDAAWSQLVSRWIDESGDASVLELADELGASSPDHRVARLASFLDPHRPPSYHDRPLDRRRLRDMAARSAHDPPAANHATPGPGDAEVLRVVLQDRLLTAWSSAAGFGALRRVEHAWATEVDVVLHAPLSLAGRDRPAATFARGVLLIDALGELTTVCPVCGQDAAEPATTCRFVLALAALAERPPGLGAGAALLLWSAARHRRDLSRRADQLDRDLSLARVDNEPAAAHRNVQLSRVRWWVGWGLAALVVVTAFGLGAGRRGVIIGALFATALAGVVRWWLDRHRPLAPPHEHEPSTSEVIDLVLEGETHGHAPPPPEPSPEDPGPALDVEPVDAPTASDV